MGSSASEAGETAKKMPKAAMQDLRFGLGIDKFGGQAEEAEFRRRTEATVERERLRNEQSGESKPAPRQSTMARSAAPSYGVGGVASAPALPNPDAVGETEQALLDAQSRGRSSTIATSAKGLLAGEESTRKKRSLMGGLIR